MKGRNMRLLKWLGWIILLIGCLVIRGLAYRSEWVENSYSTGFYPGLGRFFRRLFGWIPFSVGDLLYLGAGVWILIEVIRRIGLIYKGKYTKKGLKEDLLKYFGIFLLIYFIFNLNWGLNYNRLGIARQLNLEVREYPLDTLKLVTGILLDKTNNYKEYLADSRPLPPDQVYEKAIGAYNRLYPGHSFLNYSVPSVKSSMFGVLGNYMGYMGYFNPFTGEAQVNQTVPAFALPFVTCHEIAHQLGYARENEANFVGYLAARSSGDTAFLYSVYFDLFLYANSELMLKDTAAAGQYFKQMNKGVRSDYLELKAFYRKYENPLDRLIDLVYDRYLRLNEQPEGRKSYNKVVVWLMAYYARYHQL